MSFETTFSSLGPELFGEDFKENKTTVKYFFRAFLSGSPISCQSKSEQEGSSGLKDLQFHRHLDKLAGASVP